MIRRILAFLLVGMMAAPAAAFAIEPPQWVATLYVAAQTAAGLRWGPVPGATGYKVLRSTTPGAGHVEITTTAAPQYFDKTLEPGQTYYYILQSVGGAETSAPSAERSVAVPGVKKVEVLMPPVLKDVVLSQTTEFGKTVSKVAITWSPAPTAIAYNIYRSTTKGKDYQLLTSTSEGVYIDATVELGKTYYYAGSSLDAGFQESPYSEEKSIAVTEPEKKAAAAVKKDKVKMKLRKTTMLHEISEGPWGKLLQPSGIAVAPNGDTYIVDPDQGKVFVFNAAGGFLFAFGEEEKLRRPLDVAVSRDGTEVVVVPQEPTLHVYTADGQHRKVVDVKDLMKKDEPDEGKRQVGKIRAAPDGGWYLSNGVSNKLWVVDSSFKLDEVIGAGFGTEPGMFNGMTGIAQDPKNGNIMIADMFNFRVQVFKKGESIVQFGSYGNSVSQFGRVMDLVVMENGDILVVDFMNANVQAFDQEGKFLYVLGNEAMDNQIKLGGPSSVEYRDGKVYVTNKYARNAQVYQLQDEIGDPKLKK